MKKRAIASLLTLCLLANNCSVVSASDGFYEVNEELPVQSFEADLDTWSDFDVLDLQAEELSEERSDEETNLNLLSNDDSEFDNNLTVEKDYSDSEESLIEEEILEDASGTDISQDGWIDEIEFGTEYVVEQAGVMAAADDVTYSGVDGDITWSVESGTLTLSGSGAMKDYVSPEEVPWYVPCVKDYADEEEGLIIVYEGNVQSGTAKVKVCGHGEYSGQIDRVFYIQPTVSFESSAGEYDGKKHELDITAEGDAALYFSATTPLTYSNYEEAGTTTVPSRITAGTTKVYYFAVPNHNPTEECCVGGEAEFTVAKGGQSVTADISNASLWIGETAQITASAKAGALSFSSDNESIASVDETGIVTGIGEGQTKITVTAAETANYKEDSFSLIVSVSPQVETSLYECEIDVQTGIIYSGTPVEPNVTIHYDGHLLSQGKAYLDTGYEHFH